MTEENKHMDDAFKKASSEVKTPYSASFWDAAKAKLEDANLDDAFRAAAGAAISVPTFENTENVDDLFMDAAFVEAATETSVPYDASLFEQFKASESNTLMDEAFQTAAAATVVDYMPKYWSAADKALMAEGLHYEYSSAYWNDAKRLLDRSDRKVFFAKWSAVAAVLLLISFSGSLIGITKLGADVQFKDVSASTDLGKLIDQKLSLSNISSNKIEENGIQNNTNESSIVVNHHNELSNVNVQGSEGNVLVNAQSNVITNQGDRVNNTGATQVSLAGTNGLGVFKSPVISIGNPELSPISYDIDDRTYVNKLPVNPYDNRELGIQVPLMEINKGQDAPRNMHSFAILGQIGVGNRWGTTQLLPSLRSAVGFDYTLSGFGTFKNFEFNTNLMLNHVRQNNLGFEDRSTEYDNQGGFHNYWRKIQYKDTWMVNLNANVNIRLAARHKVRLGGGVEYLVGVRSNMSFRDSKLSEIDIVNNNWGVKEGITKLDFKLSVGYDFQITNSLALQLTGNYGFRDRTDDAFLKSPVVLDREVNVMVGVKYTLFRKL